jgi:hypothetical protein
MMIPKKRPPTAGDEADEYAHHDRDDHREERQLEGRRAVLLDDLRERTVVGDRGAEVAAHDVPEVVAVLGVQRLVEAQPMLDLLDRRLRDVATERCLDRVPRGDAHQEEDERQEDEHHRHDERDARDEVRPERGAGHS